MAKHMLEEYEQAELIEYIRDLFHHCVIEPIGKAEPGVMAHGQIRKACERKTKDLRQIDQAIYQLLTTEGIEVVDLPAAAGRPTKRWQWVGK
jgi:hypothetical protein